MPHSCGSRLGTSGPSVIIQVWTVPGGSGLPVADSTEVRAGGDHGLNGLGARETIGPGVMIQVPTSVAASCAG